MRALTGTQRIKAVITAAAVLLAAAAAVIFLMKGERKPPREKVTIAVAYSEFVQDFGTNYYTEWLREKTGFDIDFVCLDEGYGRESLRSMLTAPDSTVDAVFLNSSDNILTTAEYLEYISEGRLSAPEDFLPENSNLAAMTENLPDVDLDTLAGSDGRLYCFPSVNAERASRNMQILWINIDYLSGLGLTMPKTTDEFRETLTAFRDRDPNRNGAADELPLISCETEDPLKSYYYLLNAFTYFDGEYIVPGSEQALRKGIEYCAGLYRERLIAGDCFSYTAKQLSELVNDPADTVGAFSSKSIADVVYTNNPGILAHFVQLAPLSSECLERGCAVSTDIVPSIGGLIPANAAHKEAAALIMDTMLSDEAALIALYGEQGVDWRFSVDGELSTYGTRASVTTIRYLKNERQNKNYAGVGPLMAKAEYTDGVTWNGDHSMTAYIDARAVRTYEAYYRPSEGAHGGAAELIKSELPRFITGERDIYSDEDWQSFLTEYEGIK